VCGGEDNEMAKDSNQRTHRRSKSRSMQEREGKGGQQQVRMGREA
jgi:hypothetical protein